MAEKPTRMPEQVYTVGDTVRLSVSFLSEANIEGVEATFYRRETTFTGYMDGEEEGEEGLIMRDVSQSTISFEGTVEEAEIAERRPYALPLKRHTAVLLSFVDKDHVPGSYLLTRLMLRTANGAYIPWEPDLGDPIPSFRVAQETDRVEGVKIEVSDEPDG